MSISTSSIASTLGIGSGIDMAGLAVQLAEAQFAGRTERLTAKSESLERKISLAGSIRSSFSTFTSALGDRLRTGDLAPVPKISDPKVASVSTPPGSLGKGTFSLEVSQLASNQTLAGPVYAAATDTVGAGTLTIRFGETSNAAFTEDTTKTALSIAIAPGATLSDVAAAINGENAGLNAYVAETSAGAQLVVKGEEGLQNGFVFEVTEDTSNPGLSALAWQPGGDPSRLIQTSADAQYKLDGIDQTSATNQIDNAAPGISLSLTGTNAGAPAQISFDSADAAISSVMQDITGALNEVISELRAATDAQTGELARDTGARAFSRKLSGIGSEIIMPDAPAGSPQTLAEIGLAIERDGSFRFDSARLTEVLARDPSGVAAMFTTGINGIYSTIDKISRSNSLSSDPGSLAGSINRYQTQSQQVERDLGKIADQRDRLTETMVARFSKAESRVAASKSTLSFLEAQIDIWTNQKN